MLFSNGFSDDQFQVNASKCHGVLSTDEYVQINLGAAQTEKNSSKWLLGVIINFEKHLKQTYAKTREKLKALTRITTFMNIQKKERTDESIFTAQFNCCSLIWMIHSRKLNVA